MTYMKKLTMRDKQFWANLTRDERSELMMLQTSPSSTGYGGGGYLPDDCSECGVCGDAIFGSGWCDFHYKRFSELMKKGEGAPQENNINGV